MSIYTLSIIKKQIFSPDIIFILLMILFSLMIGLQVLKSSKIQKFFFPKLNKYKLKEPQYTVLLSEKM